MRDINQFLHMAMMHEELEEQPESQRTLFQDAAYAELLQKLSSSARAAPERRSSPRSYAPSRFGAPIPDEAREAVALPIMPSRRRR